MPHLSFLCVCEKLCYLPYVYRQVVAASSLLMPGKLWNLFDLCKIDQCISRKQQYQWEVFHPQQMSCSYNYHVDLPKLDKMLKRYMSNPSNVCTMWWPLNLVLGNCKYLWFYCTFCIVISHGGPQLAKLLIHTFVMCTNAQKYIKSLLKVLFAFHFPPYLL